MPRVLLIHPWGAEIFPPPAIGYLRAVLDAYGIEAKSTYMPMTFDGEYDFIGISLHSFSVQYMPDLLPGLRKAYPKARIIAGGHHATALPNVGLTPICQFIVGLPGETEASMAETIGKASHAGITPATNKAWILPGTDIYQKALAYGFDSKHYLRGVPFYEYEWPAGTLDRWERALRSA